MRSRAGGCSSMLGLPEFLHALREEASLVGGQGGGSESWEPKETPLEAGTGRAPTGPVKRLRLLGGAWDTGLEGGKVWHPPPRPPFPSQGLQCDMLSSC